MREEGAAGNSVLPFADLAGVHFARLFVIAASTDLDVRRPACLFTWPTSTARPTGTCVTSRHRSGRALTRSSGTARATRRSPSPGTRLAWLLPRTVAPADDYVHRIGRTVEQVHEEHRLREAVESYPRPARHHPRRS